jgi:hypothetical protein
MDGTYSDVTKVGTLVMKRDTREWIGIVQVTEKCHQDDGIVAVKIVSAVGNRTIGELVLIFFNELVTMRERLREYQRDIDLFRLAMPATFEELREGDMVIAGEICVGEVTDIITGEDVNPPKLPGVIIDSLLGATPFYAPRATVLFMPEQKLFPEDNTEEE